MAGRETRRREQRKKEERERARAEERAEQRREEERERRREEEREAEREEERRAEALQRAREFEATEQRARERQERYRERLRAERHAEAQAAARSSERRETSQSERREESRSERHAARREQARAAERESERRRLQTAAERDRRREQAQAEDRERDRREASREEGRRERLGQSEQQRREEERREEQRAVAQDARRQEARANEERRNGEAQRRDEARRTRADERRSADRQQARSQARTADAAAERRTERRRLTRQRLPTGERSGSLAWLRTSRRFVVDEAGDVVTLRGVTLRGLERSEPVAGMFDPAADAEELALLADWGATAVLVPIAQNLVLDGVETADADDYLDALDRTIETAAEAGVYTVVQLSLLNSRLPTHSREGSSAFDPQVPDPRSIDLWSLLAQRYRSEPAVLFDLFRAPHEPDPESADALEPVPWEVWRRYLLAMIGEIRRAHPRALVFARGLARGSDLSGFPLRYSDGTFVPNVVYGAEVGDEDPTVAFRALAPLARTHPVGVLAVRTGPLDVPAVELLGEVLARAGYHWFADGWREPGAELVVRSRLRTTPLGNAFAGALARPPAPEANLDRTSNGGGGGGGVAGAFRLLARMLPGAIPPGAPTPAPAASRPGRRRRSSTRSSTRPRQSERSISRRMAPRHGSRSPITSIRA